MLVPDPIPWDLDLMKHDGACASVERCPGDSNAHWGLWTTWLKDTAYKNVNLFWRKHTPPLMLKYKELRCLLIEGYEVGEEKQWEISQRINLAKAK